MELEVTFGRAAGVWWSWTWRAMVITLLACVGLTIVYAVLSFVLAMIKPGSSGLGIMFSSIAMMLFIFACTVAAFGSAIIAMKKIINKSFSKYRLSLVSNDSGGELEGTWKTALKFWWAYTWRNIFFTTIPQSLIIYMTGLFVVDKNTNDLMGIIIWVPFLFVSIWVMKMVLIKKFKGFRLALLANSNLTENKANA